MMNNEDMIRKIKEESASFDPPASLSPDAVRQMLEEKGSRIREAYKDDPDVPVTEEMPVEGEKIRPGAFRKDRRRRNLAAAVSLLAAALLLFTGIRIWTGTRMGRGDTAGGAQGAPAMEEAAAESYESADWAEAKAGGAGGDYLTPAADYEEVYEALKNSRRELPVINGMAGGYEIAKEESTAESAAEDGGSAAGGYAKTNVREEGVGESDIAKTDGSYIYTLNDDRTGILVTSARGGDLQRVSKILPDLGSGSIREFYLQEERLVILAEYYRSCMTETEEENVFSLESTDETHVISYDISDREKPVLTGTLRLDGYFRTARFHDGYAYILTASDRPLYADLDEKYEEASFADRIIPKVNGVPVPAGSIYCPPNLSYTPALTVTGMDLQAPGEAVDAKVFLGWTSDYYVSEDAIYLEVVSGHGDRTSTDIVKASCDRGKILPIASASVPGTLESSFSIDQSGDGYLRAAVTGRTGGNVTSGVYIFDRDMNPVGSLTGLAPGEEIQSARFLDDMLYLVTFRNTDPLFTVDLSDPEEPRLLGELKIPGFSDYLHFWGEDSLLGIGWDADEKDGGIQGLKLTMFDISDPLAVREISSLIMKNYWQCDGLDDYRMLLVDPGKNLIGFEAACETEEEEDVWEWKDEYHVFSFEDGKFRKLAALDLESLGLFYGARGLYIGDTFYLAEGSRILAFDLKEDFKKIGEIR